MFRFNASLVAGYEVKIKANKTSQRPTIFLNKALMLSVKKNFTVHRLCYRNDVEFCYILAFTEAHARLFS